MNNTYYFNTTEDNETTEAVYDRLFKRFQFIASIKDADIIIVAGHEPVPEAFNNVAKIHLVKPNIDKEEKEGKKKSFDETFVDNDKRTVYVTYSNNLAVSSEIIVFLNSKGFYSAEEGNLEVVNHINDMLRIREGSFLFEILSENYQLIDGDVSFQEYMTYLISKLIPIEEATSLVSKYINEFYVSFTTRDHDGSAENTCNMETKEFIGDRISFIAMTRYFLNRFQSNEVPLTQNQMTHLHQDYFSTEIQASISFSLFFFKFVRSNSRTKIGTHEDLFEAFIGTLYEISFREEVKGERPPLNLHTLFLTKLYDSFEMKLKDKPIVTVFSEMMVALTKRATDREKGYKVMEDKNNIHMILFNGASIIREHLDSKLSELPEASDRIDALIQLFRKRMDYNQTNKSNQIDAYYQSMVNGIANIVGEELLTDLQNLKSLTKEQLLTLKGLIPASTSFSCHLRNIERNWSDTYWELEYADTKLSTRELPNPDMFETLISLIKGETDDTSISTSTSNRNTSRSILTRYSSGDKSDFVLWNGEKHGISSTASAWEMRDFLNKNKDAKLYTVILRKEIDCSLDNATILTFQPQFRRFTSAIEVKESKNDYISHICNLLNFDYTNVNKLGEDMYSYVGNRLIIAYAGRIFYSKLRNADEHYLTMFQQYYTSKIVKREIGRLMKIPETFSLDELLGRLQEINERYAEALINLIYLNLHITMEDCFEYGKEVNKICTLIDLEENPPPKVDKKEKEKKVKHYQKSYFSVVKNEYRFQYKDITASVSFKFKQYSWIRCILEKEVYLHLLQRIGSDTINNLINRRFRNDPSYSKLVILLKHKGILSFAINPIELRRKRRFQLRLFSSSPYIKITMIICETLEEAYSKL